MTYACILLVRDDAHDADNTLAVVDVGDALDFAAENKQGAVDEQEQGVEDKRVVVGNNSHSVS